MGIFDRFKQRRSPAADPWASASTPAADSAPPDPEAVEELKDQVELWVGPGFHDRSEVLEYARDYRDDAVPGVTDDQLQQLVDGVWQIRLAEQADWPEWTDADKLAAAFAELDASGVVARMNFACCQTCGVAEIGDERPAGRPSSGYVFFHEQDSERLMDDPAVLYLAFGTLDPEPGKVAEQDEEVGRRIETALRAQGLPVEWNGSSQQRIQVGPLTWRRRLPG